MIQILPLHIQPDPDECYLCFGIISALLAGDDFMFICWAGCLDNVVHCSSVDVLKGLLDSFSFGCLNVGVYLSGS